MPVVISVLEETFERWRQAARRMGISVPQLVERACRDVRPTGAIDTSGRSATCAVCVRSIAADAHLEPLGKGDALVPVCKRCATEPVVPKEDVTATVFRDGRGPGRRTP